MISLASLTDVTLNDAAKIEQIRLLIVESLESALSTLRELAGIIEKETLVATSSGDINENTNLELTGIDENLDMELATINALSAVPD